MVDRVVPFESLRAEIEAVVLRPASEKKRNVERKGSALPKSPRRPGPACHRVVRTPHFDWRGGGCRDLEVRRPYPSGLRYRLIIGAVKG
jgi:hypothetical protein